MNREWSSVSGWLTRPEVRTIRSLTQDALHGGDMIRRLADNVYDWMYAYDEERYDAINPHFSSEHFGDTATPLTKFVEDRLNKAKSYHRLQRNGIND